MSGVRLDTIVKRFGTTEAVRGVTLDIADGEFVVFVGPSGCGKTTTLNMIAGLESPTSGDVYIGAERVTDWEPRDRNLGMVFQSLALFPHMTVFDNIGFPLRIKHVPAATIAERVRAVAATVKVDHLLAKKPATLSGGEAQRVALARTIVVHPAVFLMDEPLSSLDAKLRVEMRTELKRLHASLGATFIYVTHDQAEAMTMADRIVVMNQGRVQQVGPPMTIYGDPANRFVAGFFGIPAMNFIEGELRGGSDALTFEAPAVRFALKPRGPVAPCRATLGIRPEHVRLTVRRPRSLGDGEPHRAHGRRDARLPGVWWSHLARGQGGRRGEGRRGRSPWVQLPRRPDRLLRHRQRRSHSALDVSGQEPVMPEYDVIVVGAGNAAMAAAMSAREQGAARVVVLEKATEVLRGGNTHYSGGLFRFAYDRAEDLRPLVPDVERQVSDFFATVEPYPIDHFRADLHRVTEGRTDPELSEILLGRSYDTLRWVAAQGVVLEAAVSLSAVKVDGKVRWSPGAILRAQHEGVGLSRMWFDIAARRGVEIRYETGAVTLLQDRRGHVTGVGVRDREGYRIAGASAAGE